MEAVWFAFFWYFFISQSSMCLINVRRWSGRNFNILIGFRFSKFKKLFFSFTLPFGPTEKKVFLGVTGRETLLSSLITLLFVLYFTFRIDEDIFNDDFITFNISFYMKIQHINAVCYGANKHTYHWTFITSKHHKSFTFNSLGMYHWFNIPIRGITMLLSVRAPPSSHFFPNIFSI